MYILPPRLVIVAVVLIVSFSLLDKRSKASQCHIVQQGHNSLTLNPYAKTKTREAEATYDNFKKDCQLGEKPSVNTTNGQHVYDDMVFVGTSEYTVHLGNVPELPPRNSKHAEKIEKDYEYMDAPNPASESRNYAEIYDNEVLVLPPQMLEHIHTETSLMKIEKGNQLMDTPNPAGESGNYEEINYNQMPVLPLQMSEHTEKSLVKDCRDNMQIVSQ